MEMGGEKTQWYEISLTQEGEGYKSDTIGLTICIWSYIYKNHFFKCS